MVVGYWLSVFGEEGFVTNQQHLEEPGGS